MPGEKAVNEIFVMRGAMHRLDRGAIVQAIDDLNSEEATTIDFADVISIPVKGKQGTFPELSESDITLNDGDVLFIKGRQQEVFYTGGLLEGGRFPLATRLRN